MMSENYVHFSKYLVMFLAIIKTIIIKPLSFLCNIQGTPRHTRCTLDIAKVIQMDRVVFPLPIYLFLSFLVDMIKACHSTADMKPPFVKLKQFYCKPALSSYLNYIGGACTSLDRLCNGYGKDFRFYMFFVFFVVKWNIRFISISFVEENLTFTEY